MKSFLEFLVSILYLWGGKIGPYVNKNGEIKELKITLRLAIQISMLINMEGLYKRMYEK